MLAEGLRVRVALLPAGEDPDSFTRQHGADAFTALTDRAINLIEFQIQAAIQQQDIHRVDVKARVVSEITETLLNLKSHVERSEYVKYAARELHIGERVIWQELRDAGLKVEQTPQNIKRAKRPTEKLSPRAQIEIQLIEALILSPALIPQVKSQLHYQVFTEPRYAKIAQLLWEASADEQSVDMQALISECPDEQLRAILSNALLRRTPPPNLQQARVDGCLKKLRDFLLQDREQRVRSNALAAGADEMTILKELVELSNERRALTTHLSEESEQNI